MVVNPAKSKKLTNVRASGSDDAVMLTPHVKMSLEQYMAFIDDTELIECTPESIRMAGKKHYSKGAVQLRLTSIWCLLNIPLVLS